MSSKLPARTRVTIYPDDVVVHMNPERSIRFDELSSEEQRKVEQLIRRHPQFVHRVIYADHSKPKMWPEKAKEGKKLSRLRHLLLPAGPHAVEKATYLLDIVSALVPKRISNEEIGDALETINRMAKAGRPKWLVYLKVLTTFWWVFLHTLLHYAERVVGILKLSAGKSDDKK